MKKVFTIAKKEWKGYFQSPTAYIVLIIMVSVFNIFFFMIVDENREASLRDVFQVMEFMFVFLLPFLTMRIFAKEKLTGTMEFLMTTPTTPIQIVLGKYLGTLLLYSCVIGFSLSYFFFIEYFSHLDLWATLIGYLGLWLEGAMFIAIGLWASSWTRSHVVAAISTYAILFLLYFSLSFMKYVDGTAEGLIHYISTLTHSQNFFVGLLTLNDIVYYVSGIVVCLFLTRLQIENQL